MCRIENNLFYAISFFCAFNKNTKTLKEILHSTNVFKVIVKHLVGYEFLQLSPHNNRSLRKYIYVHYV